MQINSKIFDFTAKHKLWILKNILFVGVLLSIFFLLEEKGESIERIWKYFVQMPVTIDIWVVLVLIPVNWAFEAWKWQRLAAKVERISFWEAYQGVLAGLALATITPFMLGDYAGKILVLKTRKRTTSIGAILLGNGMQLYVSLLFGTFGYIYFVCLAQPQPFLLHIIIVVFLLTLLLIGLYLALNLQKVPSIRATSKIFNYVNQYLHVIKEYTLAEIREVFLIAVGRYLVFSIQFLLILQLFHITLPIAVLFAGIGIVFLTKTLGASFNFLGDLSIRAITSIYYFGYFGVELSLITSATISIWFINVLVPMIVGSVFILALKFSIKNTKVSAQ